MNKEELIKRLIPISGFMDNQTGLLFVQTPTSKFEDFVKMLQEIDMRNDSKENEENEE